MCRNITPEDKIERCGRCGSVANPTDGWEHSWPLYGKIDLGFPAQAFGALCGMQHIAEKEHFKWWSEGHPAMTDNGQTVNGQLLGRFHRSGYAHSGGSKR